MAHSNAVDFDTLRVKVQTDIQAMKAVLTPVNSVVDCLQFEEPVGPPVALRRFEPQNVWKIRGKEHLAGDLQDFVQDMNTPKVGWLQSATGTGKSTTLLLQIQQMLKCKVICVSPIDRLSQLTGNYVRKKLAKPGGYPSVRVMTADRYSFSKFGDLTYMSATTFMFITLMNKDWLTREGVRLVYVDEAHIDGHLYGVIKEASFVGVFGGVSFVFSTATPPGVTSVESYRDVPVEVVKVPSVSPALTVGEQFDAMGVDFKSLTGSIVVFCANHEHAVSVRDYISDMDVDVFFFTEESSTKDAYATIRLHDSCKSSTKILLTTFIMEYGYTIALDKAVDFSMKPAFVYDNGVFKYKLRFTTPAESDQRAGRCGRLGKTAMVYRAGVAPIPGRDYDTTFLFLKFAWMKLLNTSSNSKSYDFVRKVIGRVTINKLWLMVSAAMHPALLLKYLNADGLPYRCFSEGLLAFLPSGWKFSELDNTPYSEVTASFQKYVNHEKFYDCRVPLSPEQGVVNTMVFMDYAALGRTTVVNPGYSLAGDAAGYLDDLRTVVSEPLDDDNPWGVRRDVPLDDGLDLTPSTSGSETEVSSVRLTANVVVRDPFRGLPSRPNQFLDRVGRFGSVSSETRSELTETIYPVRSVAPSLVEFEPGNLQYVSNDLSMTPYAKVLPRQNRTLVDLTQIRRKPLPPLKVEEEDEMPVFEPEKLFFGTYQVLSGMSSAQSKVVFPYLKIPANRDEYMRPTDADLQKVSDLVKGRIRLSDVAPSQIDSWFIALVRCWNASVVDASQYSGQVRRRRRGTESGSSRISGPRYEVEVLLPLFQAFRHYSKYPCVYPLTARVMCGVGDSVSTLLEQLAERGVTVTRDINGYDVRHIRTALSVFMADDVLDIVSIVHWPRALIISIFGVNTGMVYAVDGLFYSFRHNYYHDSDGADNDLFAFASDLSRSVMSEAGLLPVRRLPVLGETAFVLVKSPTLSSDFSLIHKATQRELRFCGPLIVSELQGRGFWAVGTAEPGSSGSPVIACCDGAILGLLQLSHGEVVRVMYI